MPCGNQKQLIASTYSLILITHFNQTSRELLSDLLESCELPLDLSERLTDHSRPSAAIPLRGLTQAVEAPGRDTSSSNSSVLNLENDESKFSNLSPLPFDWVGSSYPLSRCADHLQAKICECLSYRSGNQPRTIFSCPREIYQFGAENISASQARVLADAFHDSIFPVLYVRLRSNLFPCERNLHGIVRYRLPARVFLPQVAAGSLRGWAYYNLRSLKKLHQTLTQ